MVSTERGKLGKRGECLCGRARESRDRLRMTG